MNDSFKAKSKILNSSTLRFISVLVPALFLSGCMAGGAVTPYPFPSVTTQPVVLVPTIASPAASTYYSNGSTLTITGTCQSGDTVNLGGDGNSQQTCMGSVYSFTVNKNIDGVYSFIITQIDSNSNVSVPASLIWVRKTSISAPQITSPATITWYSGQPSLNITGTCENQATVVLSGAASGSVVCANSAFSFIVPKNTDGDYTIPVTQTDQAGNFASSTIVWHKHALVATPTNNPDLVVGTTLPFGASGGSQSYTWSFVTNNSHATFNAATNVYTAGTLANQTDTLQLTDSLGESVTVQVSTSASIADHLVIIAGDPETQTIGNVLTTKPEVQVVDQYGNGVSGQNIYFMVVAGDAQIISNPVQTSSASGDVEVSVRMGTSYLWNTIWVGPLVGTLPDVNHTGKATVLFTENSQISSTQGCFTNTSTTPGCFGANFQVGNDPVQTFAVDVNGDGVPDLLVLNQLDQKIGVLLGLGQGLYGPQSVYQSCTGPTSFVVANFVAGQKPGFAIACNGTVNSVIRVYLNNGDGTFAAQADFITDQSPSAIIAGDFDKDGKMDIAVVSSMNTVGIHWGNGSGGFTTPATEFNVGNNPTAIAAGVLSPGSNLDLVVINAGDAPETMSVLMNSGGGSANRNTLFGAQTKYNLGPNPIALALADYNGDTNVDVAVLDASADNVTVFLNNGAGVFTQDSVISVGAAPSSIATADVNHDGWNDLVVTNSADGTIGVILGQNPAQNVGAYFPAQQTAFISAPSANGISLADGNGDGNLDVFLVDSQDHYAQFLPGDGSGNFTWNTATLAAGVSAVATADFNNDGKLDLAVLSTSGASISIYQGKGNGQFKPALSPALLTANNPMAIAVADMDGDGNKDILVTQGATKTVGIYFGNGPNGSGNATFSSRLDNSVGSSPEALTVGDFYGDGVQSIAVANTGDSTISVIRGLGTRNFAAKVNYATGSAPVAILAADFNGDGILDLATVNLSDNSVSILLGNGGTNRGTFQAHIDYQVGNGPIAMVAGDFYQHNNGILDLAVLNGTDATVSILKGVGNGTFTAEAPITIGGTPSGIVTGDFNGDGILDLAVTNGGSFGYSVLLGTGAGKFGTVISVNKGSTILQSLILGDWNGDGKIDLGFVDTSNNVIEIWPGRK